MKKKDISVIICYAHTSLYNNMAIHDWIVGDRSHTFQPIRISLTHKPQIGCLFFFFVWLKKERKN